MNMKDKLKAQIKSVFSASDYKDSLSALESLEKIASNKSMDEDKKVAFNRNFYSYLRDIEHQFDEKIVLPTSHGIAYLASLTKKARETLVLLGDEHNFSFKLIDGNERFQSAWIAETGHTRYPSQFIFFIKVIMLNDLEKKGAVT